MDLLTRRFWRDEIALAAGLFAVFAAVVGLAFGFARDARLFPSIIGTAGLILTAIVLVAAIRGRAAGMPPPDSQPGEAVRIPERLLVAILAAPLFGLVFWIFGFYVASLLTALLLPPLMGYRNRRVVILFAVLTTAGTALLFPVLLDVDLPHGFVGDWLLDMLHAES